MNQNNMTHVLVRQSTVILVSFGLLFGTAGSFLAPAVALADTAVAGFSGKIVTIAADQASFTAEVRVIYAGATGRGVAGVLPKGKIVTVSVPSTAVITDFRGATTTLATVRSGTLFNATVTIDTATKTVTASKIQLGTKQAAPKPSPTPTPTASVSPSPTPATTPKPPASSGSISFAGKVISVDVTSRMVSALVRAITAGREGGGRVGIVIPGKTTTINVPADAVIKKVGAIVGLDAVMAGDLFYATVTVSAGAVSAKTITVTSKIKTITFAGEATAVSLGTDPKTFTVQRAKKQEVRTFIVNSQTKFWVGSAVVDASTLKTGNLVALSYYTSGDKYIATRVKISPRSSAPKPSIPPSPSSTVTP